MRPAPPSCYCAQVPSLDAIFVGDMQATLSVERLVGREDNVAVRMRIRRELARIDTRNVVFLGDLVARPSVEAFRELDPCLASLRDRGIPCAAAVGNHDLWVSPRRGYGELERRGLVRPGVSWQALDIADLRVILLDSNRWALGAKRWAEQARWLDEEVGRAESDPLVRATIFVSHHPPWTNSAITSDHEARLLAQLEAFHAARKTRVWISGHVHAYERFVMRGKTLMVSGSSGAPRVPLLTGTRIRHTSLATVPRPSPFGWLELRAGAHEATLTLRAFTELAEAATDFDSIAF